MKILVLIVHKRNLKFEENSLQCRRTFKNFKGHARMKCDQSVGPVSFFSIHSHHIQCLCVASLSAPTHSPTDQNFLNFVGFFPVRVRVITCLKQYANKCVSGKIVQSNENC